MQLEGLVEGITDRSLLEKLVAECGGQLVDCFGLQGCEYIRRKISGFSVRARHALPLVVLADLMDFTDDCAPVALQRLAVDPHPNLIIRFVCRELESWLLADRIGMAGFLRVSIDLLPDNPDELADPKNTLVSLARRGRGKWAKEMIPKEGSSGAVGEGYVAAVLEFVSSFWAIERAQQNSESLRRALRAVRAICQPPQSG